MGREILLTLQRLRFVWLEYARAFFAGLGWNYPGPARQSLRLHKCRLGPLAARSAPD